MSKFLVEGHIFSNYDFPSQTLHRKFLLFSRPGSLPQNPASDPDSRVPASWRAPAASRSSVRTGRFEMSSDNSENSGRLLLQAINLSSKHTYTINGDIITLIGICNAESSEWNYEMEGNYSYAINDS